jgi:hypothetical protein
MFGVDTAVTLHRNSPFGVTKEGNMRIAIAIAILAFASSTQAMPVQPQQQPDEMVTLVREGCGAGMQRINGVCRRNTTVRRACAAGMRLVNGRCVR